MEYLLFTRGLDIDYNHYYVSSDNDVNTAFYKYISLTSWSYNSGWELLSDKNNFKLLARLKHSDREDLYCRRIKVWEAFYGQYILDTDLYTKLELISAEILKQVNYDKRINEVKAIDLPSGKCKTYK